MDFLDVPAPLSDALGIAPDEEITPTMKLALIWFSMKSNNSTFQVYNGYYEAVLDFSGAEISELDYLFDIGYLSRKKTEIYIHI